MINALPRSKQFDAEVVCPANGSLAKKLFELGIPCRPLEFGRHTLVRRPDWHLGFYIRFRRILRSYKPDAMVINLDGNTPLVTLAAIRSQTPIIRFCRFEFAAPRRWIETYCWRKASAIVCPSEMVREQVLRWAPASFHHRVYRWYDPIELQPPSADKQEQLRVELNCRHSKVIGLVGRLDPPKGIETAIRALLLIRRRFPDVRLLVVGDHNGSPAGAEYARSLLTMTRSLDLQDAVSFLGYRNDVPVLLSLLDVCLLPSESESFGMVLAEAWAAGIPTVASDVGGCREITLASGGGRLSPVGDAGEMARLTLEYLDNPQLACSAAASGKAWVQAHCDPNQYLARFQNLVESLSHKNHK
jgi:glycosyltransferase involved in cell wall biosynthesis